MPSQLAALCAPAECCQERSASPVHCQQRCCLVWRHEMTSDKSTCQKGHNHHSSLQSSGLKQFTATVLACTLKATFTLLTCLCRDAASAELELDQLQEVQLAFEKMDIFGGADAALYQSLADAMGWLLTWLRGKADANALPSKGHERFEGIWAGHQVLHIS